MILTYSLHAITEPRSLYTKDCYKVSLPISQSTISIITTVSLKTVKHHLK